MAQKYILCLDKLGWPADTECSMFVEAYRYVDVAVARDMVRLECFDTKEVIPVTLDQFQWMRNKMILQEY